MVIYPIRYDTRATTERLAREQSEQVTPSLPTIDTIRKPPPSGTTAPTFPGGDGAPTSGTQRTTGPFGLPSAGEIMRRRRDEERNRYPDPNGGPAPTGGPEDRPSDAFSGSQLSDFRASLIRGLVYLRRRVVLGSID